MRIARQCKNKKLFYKTTTATIFHRTQINVQQPFSNTACHCELAESFLFFVTSQSCVSSTVTLSHRFKSSPAISGKLEIPGATGYMMNVGHFRQNHVSSGDLNRSPESRGSQTSGVLPILFVQAKRINPFLAGSFEVLQTSKQRTKLQLRTNPIKTFPKEASRFCKPRSSTHRQKLHTNPIKSFAAPPLFSALRRCPCRDGTLRVLFAAFGGFFLPAATIPAASRLLWRQAAFVTFLWKVCPCRDSTRSLPGTSAYKKAHL